MFGGRTLVVTVCLVISAASIGSCDTESTTVTRDANYRAVVLPADARARAILPDTWQHTSSSGGEHFVLALAASPRRGLIAGRVEGSPTGKTYRVQGILAELLEPADVFIEVTITYISFLPEEMEKFPPVPRQITEDDFEPTSEAPVGRPIMAFSGIGGDGGLYEVRYWQGPDANPEDAEDLSYAISHLRLPECKKDVTACR